MTHCTKLLDENEIVQFGALMAIERNENGVASVYYRNTPSLFCVISKGDPEHGVLRSEFLRSTDDVEKFFEEFPEILPKVIQRAAVDNYELNNPSNFHRSKACLRCDPSNPCK